MVRTASILRFLLLVGLGLATALVVQAFARAGEPPAAPPPAAAPPAVAPAADAADPAALRRDLLARMDAKIEDDAARAHLEARLTLDEVLPIPYLGIDAEAADGGMRVTKVYGGTSAEALGLAPGDLVTAVAGRATGSKEDLGRAIRTGRVDAPLSIRFVHAGKEATAVATLGKRPEEDEDEDEQFPGLYPAAPAAAPVAKTFDFEADALGALPASLEGVLGGHGRPGRFVVVASEAGHALRQEDGDPTGIRFPMALVRDVVLADVTVKVRFRYVAGAADRAAGVVVRLRDPANYLVARTNAAEGDLRIFRTVHGLRRTLPGGRAVVSTDDERWHELVVTAEGPKVTATLDGTTTVSSYDTYLGKGRVGVWTKSDSRTDFDDLAVASPGK